MIIKLESHEKAHTLVKNIPLVLVVRTPCAMADQLSPDEKFQLITRNLQVGHKHTQFHTVTGDFLYSWDL